MTLINALTPANIAYQTAHVKDDRTPALIASLTITLVLAFLGIAARLVSRRLIKAKLQLDDYFIIVSLLFTVAFCAELYVFAGVLSLGRHEVLVSNPVSLILGITAGEIVYTLGICWIKASICALFWRLFPVQWFRWSLVGIIVFVLAYSAVQIICICVTCIPLRAIWDPTVQATCIDISTVYLVVSILNIFTDLALVAIPMPLLWSLNIKMAVKVQLSIMFGLGALVCIISVIRVTVINQVTLVDTSYSDVPPIIWSALELGFGTLGACMPTFGPILRYVQGGRAAVNPGRSRAPGEPRTGRRFPVAKQISDSSTQSTGMYSDTILLTKVEADEQLSSGGLNTPNSTVTG